MSKSLRRLIFGDARAWGETVGLALASSVATVEAGSIVTGVATFVGGTFASIVVKVVLEAMFHEDEP